ncbi:MAG: MlaE family lipid ABC transporter permease subunit [Chromatiales bacterium]|nr:MAG: MlaE family lipid ABC transporter permease subunit [Chromatiales bacterium]
MPQPATLDLRHTDDGFLQVRLAGDWLLAGALPSTRDALDCIGSEPRRRLVFDTAELGHWDTALLTTLVAICRAAERAGISVSDEHLPEGARRLMRLAATVKEPEGARRHEVHRGVVEQVGQASLGIWAALLDLVRFIGVCAQSVSRLVRGRATYQRSDFFVAIQEAGVESLPIVSLISFLIGMIFAFVGARQLEPFGAGIYVADLVAVAMVREMAPIMTAIIMAGRIGAAYAASLGTMKVNEEIDALSSMGVNPIDFLVLPRLVALVVMMPLLTLYGSLLGILGGAVVSLIMLDVSLVQYVAQTSDSMGLGSLLGGLFKAFVYGSLVAMAGCQQGMACGSSAMAVGQATTRAVVMGIVLVVVSASLLTIIYINLDI